MPANLHLSEQVGVFRMCDAYTDRSTWAVPAYFLHWDQFLNGVYYINCTQNDWIEYKFSHKKGSFTFGMLTMFAANNGIVSIIIDGVSQGTIDLYGVNYVHNQLEKLAVEILEDGEHTLRIQATGSNPLSTGWDIMLDYWWIT